MHEHGYFIRPIICILFYLIPCLGQAQNQYNLLVPIRANGLWGFIDTAGRVVITPKFLSAGDFSEGLAPVRIAGSYGYVNEKGKMQIKAQFDYAESFIDGLGKVWIDAKPFFVDKKGRLTYSNQFQKINGFKDGEKRAIVTVNNKMGLIDRQGRLVLDTVYGAIARWTENCYICYYRYSDSMVTAQIFTQNHPYTRKFSASCILDSNGVVIVPTGIFSLIKGDRSSVFANVEIIGDTTTDYAKRNSRYITTDGHLLIPELLRLYNLGQLLDNVSLFNVRNYGVGDSIAEGLLEAGWINQNGQFILPDTLLEIDATNTPGFNNGRFLGLLKREKVNGRALSSEMNYALFGKDGKRVSNRIFKGFIPFLMSRYQKICFWDGMAVVKNEEGFFEIIDTMGQTILKMVDSPYARHSSINWSRGIRPMGDFFVFETDYNYGEIIWNFKKNEIVQASLTAASLGPGHRNWLLRSLVYGQGISYYNRSGKKIWQEKMNGFSQLVPAKKIFADQKIEWIPAIVKSIPENFPGLLKDSLYGLVRKEDTTLYYQYGKNLTGFKAFKGYFINNTLDTHFFKEPSFNLEILEKDGKWRDMMYRRRVVCRSGSDGLQSLAPKSMYEFTIPDFDGTVEAQIRLVVWVDPIYYKSQPVKVRINPSQLWRNPIDSPSGIIEPYYDIGW